MPNLCKRKGFDAHFALKLHHHTDCHTISTPNTRLVSKAGWHLLLRKQMLLYLGADFLVLNVSQHQKCFNKFHIFFLKCLFHVRPHLIVRRQVKVN